MPTLSSMNPVANFTENSIQVVPEQLERYKNVATKKAQGETYTPVELAKFLALELLQKSKEQLSALDRIRVLDPAVGEGELLVQMAYALPDELLRKCVFIGYETNPDAANNARERIERLFPNLNLQIELRSFLDYCQDLKSDAETFDLFSDFQSEKFDLIIANPPYVRTQILGAKESKRLTAAFGLSGRVDLSYAFIIGMVKALSETGVAGIITSNRFLTIKSGHSVREYLSSNATLLEIIDFGDTKLFDAAVLPAVTFFGGRGIKCGNPVHTSIYQLEKAEGHSTTNSIFDVIRYSGSHQTPDGRFFDVRVGTLNTKGDENSIWTVRTNSGDEWLSVVNKFTWGSFSDLGKIRVGVKTCADSVFIRDDWSQIASGQEPELLRPLITHHCASAFRAKAVDYSPQILYPHTGVNGKTFPVNISEFPKSEKYLKSQRERLEGRKYVIEAGRAWYEIWVPQDANAWSKRKLVFRDIAKKPEFWIDNSGGIVNGDCYWLVSSSSHSDELLWLAAAVGNSTFIEKYYDYCFGNKLYSGRRRFLTQYVAKFPLPNPQHPSSILAIDLAKKLHVDRSEFGETQQRLLDELIWSSFGVSVEEVPG